MAQGGDSLVQALARDTTAYLLYTLLTVTLGPFLFGYHIVRQMP